MNPPVLFLHIAPGERIELDDGRRGWIMSVQLDAIHGKVGGTGPSGFYGYQISFDNGEFERVWSYRVRKLSTLELIAEAAQ